MSASSASSQVRQAQIRQGLHVLEKEVLIESANEIVTDLLKKAEAEIDRLRNELAKMDEDGRQSITLRMSDAFQENRMDLESGLEEAKKAQAVHQSTLAMYEDIGSQLGMTPPV